MYQIGQRTGDYEVLEVLGAGAMGQVYKVRNVLSERVEAMKVLLPNLEGQAELNERFLREIKVQATLQHKNIAQLHTAQRDGQKMLMLIEFVDGITLESAMQRGRLSTELTASIVLQVLDALAYAHARGVIHRDIKPANIMLTRDGTAKLMDFGIARMSNGASSTKAGRTVGSLYYMSPEQIRGAEDLDARSDYYSLGITLYEMVTGQRPFEGDSEYSIMIGHLQIPPRPPVELDPRVPGALNDVILQALEKEREKRFPNAEAFGRALRSAVGFPAAARTGAESTALYDSLRAQAPASSFASPLPPPVQPQRLEVPQTSLPVPAPRMQPAVATPVPAAVAARPSGGVNKVLLGAGVFGIAIALAGGGYWYWKSQQQQEEIYTSTGKPKDPEVAPAVTVPAASKPVVMPEPELPSKPPVETSRVETPPTETKTVKSLPPPPKSAVTQPRQDSPLVDAPAQPPRQMPAPEPERQAVQVAQQRPESAPAMTPRSVTPAAPSVTPGANLELLRKRYNDLALEFATAKDGVANVEGEMRSQGLTMRADVKKNVLRAEYLMKEAMDSLRAGNADAADEKLDQARLAVDWLKRFLNH